MNTFGNSQKFLQPPSMKVSKKECLECIQLNISLVKRYMSRLSSLEKSELLKELKDIFYFYGFTKEDVMGFLDAVTFEEYSHEELVEIEGVINAMLFQLKYKRQ